MNTLLISSLLILGSIGAVVCSEGPWADRCKLEQKLRAMPREKLDALEDKMWNIMVDKKCNIAELLKKCYKDEPKRVEDLIKETPCCKEFLLKESIFTVVQLRPDSDLRVKTDNVGLFQDLLKMVEK